MKRYVVGVKCGFTISDNEIIWDYKRYDFDTYKEARTILAKYPVSSTYLIDTYNLPF